jgi:hypothetical protein
MCWTFHKYMLYVCILIWGKPIVRDIRALFGCMSTVWMYSLMHVCMYSRNHPIHVYMLLIWYLSIFHIWELIELRYTQFWFFFYLHVGLARMWSFVSVSRRNYFWIFPHRYVFLNAGLLLNVFLNLSEATVFFEEKCLNKNLAMPWDLFVSINTHSIPWNGLNFWLLTWTLFYSRCRADTIF